MTNAPTIAKIPTIDTTPTIFKTLPQNPKHKPDPNDRKYFDHIQNFNLSKDYNHNQRLQQHPKTPDRPASNHNQDVATISKTPTIAKTQPYPRKNHNQDPNIHNRNTVEKPDH